MKRTVILTVLLVCMLRVSAQTDSLSFNEKPVVNLVRFELIKTDDAWKYLLLDTATGRLTLFTMTFNPDKTKRTTIISDDLTGGRRAEKGRFRLVPSAWWWEPLLIDTDNGRVWRLKIDTKETRCSVTLVNPENEE